MENDIGVETDAEGNGVVLDLNSARALSPGRYPIAGTDLEIAINRIGDDLFVRLNKAGAVQVFRAVLVNACKNMTDEQLVGFSPFCPDVRFRIGDIEEGLRRAFTTAGLLSRGP